MTIGTLGNVTFNLTVLDIFNELLLDPEAMEFVKSYTVSQEFQQAVSTTPVTPDFSALATTPDIFIFNPTSATLTVTGTNRSETIGAGQFAFWTSVNLATDLTLTLSSGTGTAYLKFFK